MSGRPGALTIDAGAGHHVVVQRIASTWSRRGRFSGYVVARCGCGWRGPGRRGRRREVAALQDATAHAFGVTWGRDPGGNVPTN